MIKNFKVFILLTLLYPCCTFAISQGEYFQQGLIVINEASNDVLIDDPNSHSMQNYDLDPGYGIEVTFDSDQLTDPAGQTFSHTVTIHSAVDYSTICVVKSNLFLSVDMTRLDVPANSNPSKCEVSTYQKTGKHGKVFGFQVIVNSD